MNVIANAYIGIGGQGDMKHIYGIIAAEGKGNQEKGVKVNIQNQF